MKPVIVVTVNNPAQKAIAHVHAQRPRLESGQLAIGSRLANWIASTQLPVALS